MIRDYPCPHQGDEDACGRCWASHEDAVPYCTDTEYAVECARRVERETSESWRRAHKAWQDWAAALLREFGLQLDGGERGDDVARQIIAECARSGRTKRRQ